MPKIDVLRTLEACARFEKRANIYRVVKGTLSDATAISDAVMRAQVEETNRKLAQEPKKKQAEFFLQAYHDLRGEVPDYLSSVATALEIDATPLDLFTNKPDPHEGLRKALVVVKRIRQKVAGVGGGVRKRRGRKPRFDARKDQKLREAYDASGIRSIKEFARIRGLTYDEADRTLKRCRARKSRDKKSQSSPF